MDIPDQKKYELAEKARKSKGTAALLGFLISPGAYLYTDEVKWALINFVTFNYLFLGFIIVPIHASNQIESARKELDEVGVDWRR